MWFLFLFTILIKYFCIITRKHRKFRITQVLFFKLIMSKFNYYIYIYKLYLRVE